MLLKPDIKLKKITDITPEMLTARNIGALLLDVDNTMSTHHGMVLTEGLTQWLDLMKNNGIRLVIVSNSKRARVQPFAEKIGLDFISMALKPLPFGFLKGVKTLGISRRNAAIVGDQIFTDVLGGNSAGLFTFLLTPIKLESSLGFRFKRRLERIAFKLYKISDYKE